MLDLNTHTRLAMAWSDAAARNMSAAMELGASSVGAAVDFWSSASGFAPARRSSQSTSRPWYRAPEPNPYDLTAWLAMFQPPRPSPTIVPFGWGQPSPMFANPMLFTGWGQPAEVPFAPLRGVNAAVPALLALVAVGAAAQQMLSMIEAQRSWQSALTPSPAKPAFPAYRSDSGHAVAGIVMPEVISAAVTLPMNGLAVMMRMMQALGPH